VTRAPRGAGRAGLALAASVLLALLAVPLLALALTSSPAELVEGLRHPLVWPALRISLITTTCCLAAVVLLGTPLAWLVARSSGRWVGAIETLAQLPVVVPPAVAGVAMLLAFGRRGLLGPALERAGIQLAFTPAAVVLAQIFVSAPFYLQAATLAFREVDERLLLVARTLGARAPRAFFRIALPLAARGLAAGAALAWARALGEFGATLMFAGNLTGRTQTLPLAIYTALEDDLRAARALSLVLVLVAAALLIAVRRAALPGLRERA
jgi:molybdate transport system permease protein